MKLPGELTFRRKLDIIILTLLLIITIAYPQEETDEKNLLSVHSRSTEFKDQEIVDLASFIPGIKIELRYATANNPCQTPIYTLKKAYLRRGTAEKLKEAQQELASYGFGLKVWDAYRPPEAQFKLWEKMPDPRFVINPYQGFSQHSRGIAVDVTLVDHTGREVTMPTDFDNFTSRADRDYRDVNEEELNYAELLRLVMEYHGFDSIFYEWWHFIDHDRSFYDIIHGDEIPPQTD